MSQIVKVLSIEHVTHDVLRIKAKKPEGLIYEPGQAVDFSINKPGWENELRPFTFTSLNEDDHIEFTIKSYSDHNGVTNELQSLQKGDEVIIGDVFGAITYKGEGIFLAGGAGVTPFIAIFKWLNKNNKLGSNKLIFANKDEQDIIMREEFMALLGNNFINILSGENNNNYLHGYIDVGLIKKYTDDNTQYYYLCGPDPMMEAVGNTLKSIGIDDEHIVVEE